MKKDLKMVEVKWLDIAESSNEWQTLDELEEFVTNRKVNIVRQVGFLFEELEDQIAIISCYFPDETYGTCTLIPKGCVLEMKELTIKNEILLLDQNS